MTEMNYVFPANYGSLSDIGDLQAGIQSVGDDIQQIYTQLQDAYDGDAATELYRVFNNFTNEINETIQNMAITGKEAQDQQDLMQALDKQNASQF
jgi:uncharacterized protein YukE